MVSFVRASTTIEFVSRMAFQSRPIRVGLGGPTYRIKSEEIVGQALPDAIPGNVMHSMTYTLQEAYHRGYGGKKPWKDQRHDFLFFASYHAATWPRPKFVFYLRLSTPKNCHM